MLVQLAIRDIVLIDRLDLDLGSGLAVLTGETGAGKSILLDAFALALGARGDGALVREGQNQGHVIAVFDPPPEHAIRTAVLAPGIDTSSDLILRRVQMKDGRTRAFVNDQPVSAQVLRRIGALLVEIHGQHDERALTDPGVHRTLLDAFGGLELRARAVREAFASMREATTSLESEEARLNRARADADYSRHAHAELSNLEPRAGEEAVLAELRTAMMIKEKVAGDLRDAHETVSGDSSPISTLSAALRRLERRSVQSPELIEPAVKAMDAALTALDVAQATLDRALRDTHFDASELERVEERLFALRAAARKHAVAADELPALAERFAAEIQSFEDGEAHLAELRKHAAAAAAAYCRQAELLSQDRRESAAKLDAAVRLELGPLKLDSAEFMTKIDSDPAAGGPHGFDHVEFWVRTNPGTRPGPLMKIASGGELARFMLALKVALADRGSAPTLVFDEIDTGVGGAIADAIGQRLARLADRVQVLAVTHAPQVAARSSTHFRISKNAVRNGEEVVTRVTPLTPDLRREEIARMLAGSIVTEEARAAARRLLETG